MTVTISGPTTTPPFTFNNIGLAAGTITTTFPNLSWDPATSANWKASLSWNDGSNNPFSLFVDYVSLQITYTVDSSCTPQAESGVCPADGSAPTSPAWCVDTSGCDDNGNTYTCSSGPVWTCSGCLGVGGCCASTPVTSGPCDSIPTTFCGACNTGDQFICNAGLLTGNTYVCVTSNGDVELLGNTVF